MKHQALVKRKRHIANAWLLALVLLGLQILGAAASESTPPDGGGDGLTQSALPSSSPEGEEVSYPTAPVPEASPEAPPDAVGNEAGDDAAMEPAEGAALPENVEDLAVPEISANPEIPVIPEVLEEPEALVDSESPVSVEATEMPAHPEDLKTPEFPENLENAEELEIPDIPPPVLALGEMETPSALPGETILFALPIDVSYDQAHYLSNMNASLSEILAYTPENGPDAYDQTIASILKMAEITLSDDQPQALPLDANSITAKADVVLDGVNYGYATLENLLILDNALPGIYTINVMVRWRENIQEKPADVEAEIDFEEEADFEEPTDFEEQIDFEESTDFGQQADYVELTDVEEIMAREEPEDTVEPEEAEEQVFFASVPFEVLAPPAALLSGMPCEDSIVVYNQSELNQALQNGCSMIYLGYSEENQGNIAYSSGGGMAIRNNVIIDGTDPATGYRMRLTDLNSVLYTDCMYAATGGISITLRNMDITGYNCFGIIYGTGASGVHIAFEGVQYTGRQMVHNDGANSSVSFQDADISIVNVGSGSEQEAAETGAVTFYGSNTIRRSGPQDLSLFYLFGDVPNTLIVMEGAVVNMITSNCMIFTENSAQTSVHVYGELNLTTTGMMGSFTYGDQYIGSLVVHEGGSLNISHQSDAFPTLQAHSMIIDGSLTIERADSPHAAIHLRGGEMQLNNPPLFSLNNPGGTLIRGDAGSSMQWNTQVINRYSGGALAAVWNNADLSPFTTSFGMRGANVRVTSVSGLESGGRGAALQAPQLSGNAINFETDGRIRAGHRTLALDTLHGGSHEVSGHSDGGMQEIREYAYADGAPGALLQQVSGVGGSHFSATMQDPIQLAGSRVYAIGDNGVLAAYTYRDPEQTGISFLEVPSTMAFETARLSGQDQIISRQDPNWSLLVFDPRGSGNAFSVHARLEAPLTSADGDMLEGSLVFAENDTMRPLMQTNDMLIAQTETETGKKNYALQWNAEEGILLRLPAFTGRAGTPYQARIVWTLIAGP